MPGVCDRCQAQGVPTPAGVRVLRNTQTGQHRCEIHLGRVPAPAAAADTHTAALALDGLTKHYGETKAVDELSFHVPSGGITGFVGPNGAGKTTTIRMVLGLIRPTAGSAHVLGHPITQPKAYLQRVGALIESPAFYNGLSGTRNLRALATLGGHPRERVAELLHQVGLGQRGDDPYRSYSLGMKQRLGIAAALLPDPDLLILDEPTNGLDPAGIREIRKLLRRLAEQGKTVFVSSHLIAEIERMCDHVVMIRQGRLVFDGPMQELAARNHGVFIGTQSTSEHAALLNALQGAGYEADRQRGGIVVKTQGTEAPAINRLAVEAGINVVELRPKAQDLEELVLRMTGGGAS